MRGYTLRVAVCGDAAVLRRMLYLAIFVPDGEAPPPVSIVDDPAIAVYVEDWGRAGDEGLIAMVGDEAVGAVWLRRFTAERPGYGFVRAEIPELTIAIEPEHRGAGLGTRMMEAMVGATQAQSISLSCDPANPALRMYLRMGFVECGDRVYCLNV